MRASEQQTGPPATLDRASRRWRTSSSWVAVLVAAVLVAAISAALVSHNSNYYEVWVYNDPQTSEEQYEQFVIDLFMAHTSGFFWGPIIALLLGVFLASRLRGVPQALGVAVPAGVLLAGVNFAVAWQLSADTRRGSAWYPASVPANLLADDRFQHVVGAGLAAYPLAAIAGVGLGALFVYLLRLPAVAVLPLAVMVAVPYGAFAAIFGWFAAAVDDEPVALFGTLGLLPLTAVTSAVQRSAVDDHGGALTLTMLISSAAWALLLISAGWLAQRRRSRVSVERGP
ncbi:hypothetical protein [Plantactinospora soyae]|uniref:Uncharacterized protein n=1 Tax=Plantactinospora soyae TaxID=1544732 RepID=A0A927R181_9ACTN|nr:hypothetical protein [Plantactinospora soyae]MBE1491072.1 hypothetical protein [Plantactinospora soyae]